MPSQKYHLIASVPPPGPNAETRIFGYAISSKLRTVLLYLSEAVIINPYVAEIQVGVIQLVGLVDADSPFKLIAQLPPST